MSSPENQPTNPEERELEEAILEVETALVALKLRYRQIIEAQREKQELQAQLNQIEPRWREDPLSGLEKEIIDIQEQIKELEVILESNLLKDGELKRIFWDGVRRGLLGEVFWQIIRFGGVGVSIGWMLRSCSR